MLNRPRTPLLTPAAFGVIPGLPATARGALLLATAATAVTACTAPAESPAASPGVEVRLDPPPLWIAVTNRGNRYIGDAEETLMPIARRLDGIWDNAPWAGLLYIDAPAAAGIEAVKTGDGVWSWPDARQYWEHPGRAADTLGRTPDVIATGVPRSWFLYSMDERGLPLSTAGLVMTQAHCDHRWAIRIAQDETPARESTDGYGPPGIAFTRMPADVLSEGDIPGLDEIRRTLGFADISEGRKGDRSFYWLGIFRFDDGTGAGPADATPADARADAPSAGTPASMTLGVLWGRYYESADYTVIRIDGDRSRVIIRTREGGC